MFDKRNEYRCDFCDGKSFIVIKGTTCIFLMCTNCERTDEISRRKLGWEEHDRGKHNSMQELQKQMSARTIRDPY